MEPIDKLRGILKDRIPLSREIGIQIEKFDDSGLSLRAPLEGNTNPKNTVFGGSLYSVAVLSGWGLLYLKLVEEGFSEFHIVILKGTIQYDAPVAGDFRAICRHPDANEFQRFLKIYRRRQKARIKLVSVIGPGGTNTGLSVTFTGNFVVHN